MTRSCDVHRVSADVARRGSCALIGSMTTNQIDAESERLLLTVLEAAERLAVGRSTVYELTAAGELEVVHIGRCRGSPSLR